MRDILTGLAIILIVVLTTILVAPYFVDWNGQRDFLEARLSHALGQKVTIGGRIDLKLLPTPYLVLDQVVVGADEAPVKIGVHHLDLELSFAPLMHGEFDIVEARLEEPTIRLTLDRDHALPTLPAAPAFEADVRFDRIQVADGTLAIADPQSGHTFVLDHVDLDADAGSLAGPFKLAGASGPAERRTRFRLATSMAQKGQSHVRLVVEETPAHAGVELDGTLRLQGAGADAPGQSFAGSLVLGGHVDGGSIDAGSGTPIAWKLSGPIQVDPARANLDGGELRLGSDDAGVTFQANATMDLTETPKLALDLKAKQLDLDRLSGAPVDAVKPPPPKLPDLATLRRILAAAVPPIATQLDVSVEAASYGDAALSDIAAHLVLGSTASTPLKLAADGPGGAHVAIDGTLAPQGGDGTPAFQGHVDLSADNLPRTLAWLRIVAPSFPATDADLGIAGARVEGSIRADAQSIGGDALTLTLDRSVLKGALHLALGDGTPAAKVSADLRAETLDIGALPGLGPLRASAAFDLDLQLNAAAVKVAQLGDSGLETGRLDLVLTKTGHALDLKRFRAENLGGATIDATGRLDASGTKVTASIDAAKGDTAAALVHQLLPGAASQLLVDRAVSLAPAKLKIDVFLPSAQDVHAPTRLSIVGTLAATTIDVAAKPDEALGGDATAITARLASADGNALLRQLGVQTLPIEAIGAARVTAEAHGIFDQPLATTLDATFGATHVRAEGAFALSDVPHGSGTLRVESADLSPLLQSLALAFPDMTRRIPAKLTSGITIDEEGTGLRNIEAHVGDTAATGQLRWHSAAGDQPALTGALALDHLALSDLVELALGPKQVTSSDAAWSRQPFAVGLVDPPRAAVTLGIKAFDIKTGIEARDASLELGIGPHLVTLDKAKASLAGGGIEWNATLRRDGRQASLEGKVRLDHVVVRLPTLSTTLDGHLDVAGGGTSAATLIGSLAGSGTARAADIDIHGGDPGALPKVFADVEADVLAVDQDSIVRALSDAGNAPLRLGTVRYALGLAAGVLHIDPKQADAKEPIGPVSSTGSAVLDLSADRIEVHVDQTLHALPKNWTGPAPSIAVTLAGPTTARPTRGYDVSGFLDAVAARALARETARIEAYEFDIRERAFFNARLQSEQRREADRQKAEDDARKAEAERKARAEAARQAKLRAEQAAKAARDNAAQGQETPAPQAPAPDQRGDSSTPPASDGRRTQSPPPDPSTLGRY